MSQPLRIIAVGRAGDGPESALVARYARRFRPALQVIELAEARGASVEAKRREAEGLLAALPKGALAIALDQGGLTLDTPALAQQLAAWRESARPIAFLIGGAEGLDAAVLARADAVFSLGRLTWPHLLARAMLAEALYRADSLLQGHPYHRAGRP